MVAILQLIAWLRYTALVYSVQCTIGQLKAIKTRYLLTSIMWSYHRLEFRAHQGHKSQRFLKLIADQVLVLDWITGSCHVNWVNWEVYVYCFSLLLFCLVWDLWNLKQNAKQYKQKTSHLTDMALNNLAHYTCTVLLVKLEECVLLRGNHWKDCQCTYCAKLMNHACE